jgi:hypothetical protein
MGGTAAAGFGIVKYCPWALSFYIPATSYAGWKFGSYIGRIHNFLKYETGKCCYRQSYETFAEGIAAFYQQYNEHEKIPEYLGNQEPNPFTLREQIKLAQAVLDGNDRIKQEQLLDNFCYSMRGDERSDVDFLKAVPISLKGAVNQFSKQYFHNLAKLEDSNPPESTHGAFRNRIIKLLQIAAWAERRNFKHCHDVLDFSQISKVFREQSAQDAQVAQAPLEEREAKEGRAKREVEEVVTWDGVVVNIHTVKEQGSQEPF